VSTPPPTNPAGWLPDPLGRYEHRYFNGSSWTADVSIGGQRQVDPLGIMPGPGPFGAPTSGFANNGQVARNRIATAAMVCGIIGVVLAWVPFVFVAGTVLGILALIFGISGLKKSKTVGKGRGLAISGIATGTTALLLSVVGVILSVVVFRAIDDFASPGPLEIRSIECESTQIGSTATGIITNESVSERGYTVFVTITRPSDQPGRGRTAFVEVERVAAGGDAPWTVTIPALTGPEPCSAEVDVQGPFPFGLEIDPIDG
jgi:hypothetical protein